MSRGPDFPREIPSNHVSRPAPAAPGHGRRKLRGSCSRKDLGQEGAEIREGLLTLLPLGPPVVRASLLASTFRLFFPLKTCPVPVPDPLPRVSGTGFSPVFGRGGGSPWSSARSNESVPSHVPSRPVPGVPLFVSRPGGQSLTFFGAVAGVPSQSPRPVPSLESGTGNRIPKLGGRLYRASAEPARNHSGRVKKAAISIQPQTPDSNKISFLRRRANHGDGSRFQIELATEQRASWKRLASPLPHASSAPDERGSKPRPG